MTQSTPSINDPNEEKIPGQSLKDFARKAMDTLLPERCFSCGEIVGTSGGLCGTCWGHVTFISEPQCRRCGRPFEFEAWGDIDCAECLRRPPVYDKARSCMVYDEGSRSAILAFKHADRTDMAPVMATWLRRAGDEIITRADMIAPVPLHWTRLWLRKYNQSAELARHLALQSDKTFAPDIIQRKRRTPS